MDDRYYPDTLRLNSVEHPITGDDDLPVTQGWEFRYYAAPLRQRGQPLTCCDDPFNKSVCSLKRIPCDEIVNLLQITTRTFGPPYRRRDAARARTSSGESVRPAAISSSEAFSFSRR